MADCLHIRCEVYDDCQIDPLGHLHEEDHWDDDVDEDLVDEDDVDWPDDVYVRPIETVHLPAEDVT